MDDMKKPVESERKAQFNNYTTRSFHSPKAKRGYTPTPPSKVKATKLSY